MATHGILLTMTVHTSYWKDIQTQIKNNTFSTEKVNASSKKLPAMCPHLRKRLVC